MTFFRRKIICSSFDWKTICSTNPCLISLIDHLWILTIVCNMQGLLHITTSTMSWCEVVSHYAFSWKKYYYILEQKYYMPFTSLITNFPSFHWQTFCSGKPCFVSLANNLWILTLACKMQRLIHITTPTTSLCKEVVHYPFL